jgi:hypothetical protein
LVEEPGSRGWKAKGLINNLKERSRLCREKMVPARQGPVRVKDLEVEAGEEPAWGPEEIVSARNAVKKVPIPGEFRVTARNVLNVDP